MIRTAAFSRSKFRCMIRQFHSSSTYFVLLDRQKTRKEPYFEWASPQANFREIYRRDYIEEALLPGYRPEHYPIVSDGVRILPSPIRTFRHKLKYHYHARYVPEDFPPPRMIAEYDKPWNETVDEGIFGECVRRDPVPSAGQARMLYTYEQFIVQGKLGYGSQSTVWLAQHSNTDRYVALKILKNDTISVGSGLNTLPESEEIAIMLRLRQASPNHPGYLHINHLLDFLDSHLPMHIPSRDPPKSEPGSQKRSWDTTIRRPFRCLAFEPMSETLGDFQTRIGPENIPMKLVKKIACQMLEALDYMHTYGVAHADIRLDNIFIELKSQNRGDILNDYHVNGCFEDISLDVGKHRILNPNAPMQSYTLRESVCCQEPDTYNDLMGLKLNDYNFRLGDFGSALMNNTATPDRLDQWRSPETLLGAKWEKRSSDIWCLGAVIWELAGGRNFLNYKFRPDDNYFHMYAHLSQQIAICGPPPPAFLEGCSNRNEFFDEQGVF
ncbi:MAG: hypothetical protein M1836_003706 [Candelina mexicana]|nr:MAG: hypothetical protein M1836_003706 [Candelina mexicana]